MTTLTKLMTRGELADLLGVTTRTLDRWRAMNVDFGEVRTHPRAVPRFDRLKVHRAIESNGFGRTGKRSVLPRPVPRLDRGDGAATTPDAEVPVRLAG